MKKATKRKTQFITDGNGKKTGVILSIEDYSELIEDIADLAILAERNNEQSLSHDEVLKDLKKDGYL